MRRGAVWFWEQKARTKEMNKTDAAILSSLREFARAGRDVDLLNSYKGIPVLFKAALHEVGDDTAVVRFEKYEAVCLTLENRTTLLADRLGGPGGAAVRSGDPGPRGGPTRPVVRGPGDCG